MIDSEVMRLRKLRHAALRARAVAAVMNSHKAQRNPVFLRSAQNCWQIARAITGRLRAHPYPSFQRGPSETRAIYDRFYAAVLGGIARYRGRSFQFYCNELRRVARELDDARALTWSPDLSDDLGRAQARLQRLIRELEVAALVEIGSDSGKTAGRDTPARTVRVDGGAVEMNWPYLNI
jgi:hypothetical protein